MVQRLLVTGGCGTLGRMLVTRAPARGWSVRATWWTRLPVDDAEWVQLDVRDVAAVREAVAGCDAVVHTAYRQGDEAWSINVEGSVAVAEAAHEAGARLVHLSTDLVFDGQRGRYREEDPLNPVSDKDFIAQLASLTTVQSLDGLNANFAQMLKLTQLTQGADLIGKTITYTATDGSTAAGAVDSVVTQNGQFVLTVGTEQIPLDQVQSVKA